MRWMLPRLWNTTEFVFTGDAPIIGNYCFNYLTATVWYPLANTTYTAEVMQNYGGTLTWKGLCTGAHTFGAPETIAATCEKGSYMTTTCTVCGYVTVSPENDDALGHEWDEENPTENEDGSLTYSCIRCDATYRTEGTGLYLGDNQFTITAEGIMNGMSATTFAPGMKINRAQIATILYRYLSK